MVLDTCKLISLKVRGINNFRKRRTIFTWCRKQKADLIFSDFFCSADEPVALCRGTTAAHGKQKASIIELVVDNSTNYSSSNINIACSRFLDSALPRFLPVLFSCLRFLNSADPTISEPGTG